jgi:hypothetical protein
MINTGRAERSTKQAGAIADAFAARAKDGADGVSASREVVVRETISPTIEQSIANLQIRVTNLENRPEPLMRVAANDAMAVPKAFGDLVERVLSVEANMASQANIDALASIIGDIGNATMTHAGVLSKRIDALEARVSNLPSDLLAEVGRAQAELRGRRT